MLRVLVLVAVTACLVSGALLPLSIEESDSIIPEQVPILDWSISAVDQIENAQGIEYDITANYGESSGTPGSYTVTESAVTAIAYNTAAGYGDSIGTPGSYTVTEYAATGSYGEGDSSASYGGRRLLDIGSPHAAAAVPSMPQTVLLIDVPDDFNPEDNSLVLSFYGEWVHTSSSSFNAAFALEMLDSEGTEVLSFEGPTLHHRRVKAPQPHQHQTPFTLQYATAFDDVLLTPGEQIVLRLTSEESVFTDFSATVDLRWRFTNTPEAATADSMHVGRQQGHYSASTVGSNHPATNPQTTKLVKRHRQLLQAVTTGAYGGEEQDLYGAITEAAGPGAYGQEASMIEAATAGTYGGVDSDMYGAITEAAGAGSYGGQQPGLSGALTEAAEPGAYGGQQRSQHASNSSGNNAGAEHLGKGHDVAGGRPAQRGAIDVGSQPNKKKAEPIVDIQDQLRVLDEKHTSESIPGTDSRNGDNMQTAMSALLNQGSVPWSYPTAAVGDAPVPAAVLKPSAPGPIQAPDAPIQPAVLPASISVPAEPTPAAPAATAVQEPGQLENPVVLQPAEAVPLPNDAYSSDGSSSSSSSCITKIPRGLQCGGTGGSCAQYSRAPSGPACKDEPYADACCASGTVCTRKSEEMWVCAPKLPGHGFVRRLLA